jgi:LmbE family N-acetylglucosaminyl deacetylase
VSGVHGTTPSALVIGCHADDETLGCGGTIAKKLKEGWEVEVVIMTRCGVELNRYASKEDPTNRRRVETRAAMDILGVDTSYFADFQEMRLSPKMLPDLVHFIRKIADPIEPELVFSHHWADLNQDHRIIAEATMLALRPHTAPWLKRLLAYPIDPLAWQGATSAHLNVFSDITETLNLKLKALACYASEMREFPHPRSLLAIEATMRANGVLAGREAAELFELVWEIA